MKDSAEPNQIEAKPSAPPSPLPDSAASRPPVSPLDGELPAGSIVRPSLFHAQGVSGTLVATSHSANGSVEPRRSLYLAWKNGKRELIPFDESIRKLDLPEGGALWFRKGPHGGISSDGVVRWSRTSREAYLEGYKPSPTELFQELREIVSRFVLFPTKVREPARDVVGLWTILTYVYPAWSAIPYLGIGGPRGSGKTRLFTVLNELVFEPLFSSSISPASLFRTVEAVGGTLLLDEAEQFQSKQPVSQELLHLLNAGYKAGNRAIRMEKMGDQFRQLAFDVYSTKAIAGIQALPPTLESRCIRINMFRAPGGTSIGRATLNRHQREFASLRDDLYCLALAEGSHFYELAQSNEIANQFEGRDYELWQPLLAIAKVVDPKEQMHIADNVLVYAAHLAEVHESAFADQFDEAALKAFSELFGGRKGMFTCRDVALRIPALSEGRWDQVSPERVAAALHKYGLHTTKSGNRRTFRDVTADQVQEIADCYGFDLSLPTSAGADLPPKSVPTVPTVPSEAVPHCDDTSGQENTRLSDPSVAKTRPKGSEDDEPRDTEDSWDGCRKGIDGAAAEPDDDDTLTNSSKQDPDDSDKSFDQVFGELLSEVEGSPRELVKE